MTILPEVSPQRNATSMTNSTVYQDVLIDARSRSTDFLLSRTDWLPFTIYDDDSDFPGDVGRFSASERLRAINVELARRERVARLASGLPSPSDRRYEAWRELARLIRERVPVPFVFEVAGYALHPAGFNGTRNADERAGPCLVCGGVDRMRVWNGPNGRAWCRQCGWSADVLTVAESLLPGVDCFRDACRRLAELAGTGQVPE